MPYLAAATVLACLLGAFNLLLTLGIVRRLRAMTGATAAHAPQVVASPGETPEPFQATTVDGEELRGTPSGLVGFFSPDCPACTERLPEFVAYATAVGRQRVLAVLIGEPHELGGLTADLRDVARVTTEPVFGPVATAFAVTGYPAVALLDDTGAVTHSGTDFRSFPRVPARV
ncbi:TlpA family protein [Dactylosporangium maewongense]|uniref:TlpA family protein n=1 Tax=Dactylosporangium maewongense TaxID=634393 RepID=A0ABP4M8Q4_9ACTN